jgi:primosomal replication protein N
LAPKIVKAYPPNFLELTKHFPIKGVPGVVYAYGDRIYNPSGIKILPWVLEHEKVHCMRQQETKDTYSIPSQQHLSGIEYWWKKYVGAVHFRLEEEVLAHRKEWSMTSDLMNPRDRIHYLDMMVDRLSGPIYGNMVYRDEARRLITEKT